jgi:hypothetical protein
MMTGPMQRRGERPEWLAGAMAAGGVCLHESGTFVLRAATSANGFYDPIDAVAPQHTRGTVLFQSGSTNPHLCMPS